MLTTVRGNCYFRFVSNRTNRTTAEIEIVKMAVAPYLNESEFDFEELRQLDKALASLSGHPGWEAVREFFEDLTDRVGFLAINSGNLDEHEAGIACGYQRVLHFPVVVKAIFEERDRIESMKNDDQES